jgi:hypothetical protein
MRTINLSESTARLVSLLIFNEIQMLDDRLKHRGRQGQAERDEIGQEIYDLKVFLKQLQRKK